MSQECSLPTSRLYKVPQSRSLGHWPSLSKTSPCGRDSVGFERNKPLGGYAGQFCPDDGAGGAGTKVLCAENWGLRFRNLGSAPNSVLCRQVQILIHK